MEMTDARQLNEPATLERMGFCLEKHPTAVRDFRDGRRRGSTARKCARSSAQARASRVFVFDHTVDSEQNELERGADATPRRLDAVDVAVRELAPRLSVPQIRETGVKNLNAAEGVLRRPCRVRALRLHPRGCAASASGSLGKGGSSPI